MIKLIKLELHNFLSHVDTVLMLNDYQGLILIEGKTSDGHYSSNGSGKSTLLEGIIYALTGDTLRGVGVNDVVNRNYGRDTYVSLEFSKDDDSYLVSRYRKHSSKGDSLELYKNGEDISKRLNKDTQKSLEDILGISYKILVSTMLLGEGLSSKFTQLSDPDKKSLIESTLNMEYDLSSSRAKANTLLSQLKLEKANSEGKLSTLKELATIDKEEYEKSLSESQGLLVRAAEGLEEMNRSAADKQASRRSIEEKLLLIRNAVVQHETLLSDIKRLDTQVESYIRELTEIESAEIPHCSLCHQSLEDDSARESVISNYRAKIDDCNTQLVQLRSSIASLPEISLLQEKESELKNQIAQLDMEMQELTASINDKSSEYWRLNNTVENIAKSLSAYEDSIDSISQLESSIKGVEYDIQKYEYFYKLFSPTGLIVEILSEAIDYINTRLSAYSEVLLERDYKIQFQKGKISLVDSKGASYQSLSNGEKRRLDISIQFSLHDYVHMYCGMKMDCCFIDEILDTLDDIGVENIFEVLRLKLEYCQLKSIYVITHNNFLKDKFDNIITVKKDSSGDSKLE